MSNPFYFQQTISGIPSLDVFNDKKTLMNLYKNDTPLGLDNLVSINCTCFNQDIFNYIIISLIVIHYDIYISMSLQLRL